MDLWLPLTQDTRQQGLSNASVTAVGSGASINANGKLGKCYYLDGTSNGYISTDFPTNFGTNDFTISLWVKIPTISSGSYYTIVSSKQSPAISVGVGIYWNYSQKRFLWSTADGTNATEIWMADAVDTIVYDKWIHLVMVRDNNDSKKGCFYINGTRYELASVPVIRNITTATNLWVGKISSGNYPCKLYVSDIRVWNDRALAPKEIEILSRGLVCHYPLSDSYVENTTNIITAQTRSAGSIAGWGGQSGECSIVDSTNYPIPCNECNKIAITYTGTGEGGGTGWIVQRITCNPSTTYTYSCYIKTPDTLAPLNANILYRYEYNSSNTKVTEVGCWSTSNAQKLTDGWYRIWGTFTVSATTTYFDVYNYVYPRKNCDYYIGCWQVETKDHMTPYVFGSRTETTAYDCSGYQYNGTISGSLTTSNDTARYSASTKYSGSNYLYVTSPSSEIRTIAFWAKWDSIPSGQSILFVDGKSKTGFGLASKGIICSSNSITTYTFNKSNLVANTWYHFVIVCPNGGSNASRKLYINGVEQTATSNQDYWVYSLDQLQIGKRSSSSDGFVGKMSDFRAYATALSATQVAELYNTAVSVANNGTLMGYELVEG